MQSYGKAFLYGFLNWLIPFVVSIPIFPLKQAGNPLFETIMPVTLCFCAVLFTVLYFGRIKRDHLTEGIKLGDIWFLISLVIDLLLFMWGPMKMTFSVYMCDIGLTYLIFPIVTIGFGFVLSRR